MTETKKRLCIIVPYRDRASHLAEFLPHMEKTLTEQGIDYEILIVEQTFEKPFNRAKLLNVGFDYTKGEFDYYCMHDVDMLPTESDYSYCSSPTHLAAHAEQFGWNTPYPEYFGGVTIFDKETFLKVNGYANEYWGWGAEDDDMYRRCQTLGIKPLRKPCRYRSLAHERIINHANYGTNVQKLQNFNTSFKDGKFIEGLSNLKYEVVSETHPTNQENILTNVKHITVTI